MISGDYDLMKRAFDADCLFDIEQPDDNGTTLLMHAILKSEILNFCYKIFVCFTTPPTCFNLLIISDLDVTHLLIFLLIVLKQVISNHHGIFCMHFPRERSAHTMAFEIPIVGRIKGKP